MARRKSKKKTGKKSKGVHRTSTTDATDKTTEHVCGEEVDNVDEVVDSLNNIKVEDNKVVHDTTSTTSKEKENKRKVLISSSGDMLVFDGSSDDINECIVTEEYDSVQRARILLDTMAYSGMGQELNLYKDSRLVIDIDDGNLTTEAAAKIKEGYEIYKSSELSDEEHMPYNDFLEMTKCIVEIWNDQISDGRGFIIFWLACKMMVDHTSIMPCHPHDALFFLIENHPALNVERKDENSMGTDILDRLDPAQISFVGNNNRLFRTLFMNYKCSVAKVFESEDITNEYEDEEDDTPMQKSQLPKGDIALVTDIMKCSEQKAVRLLKESKGEVLGALYSSSKVGKEMSEKRSPFENRIYQCMIRTTFHLKLATHGMVRALVNGHAFRLPGRRHGTTDDDEPEDFIFMLVDQSTIDRFEL